MKTIAFVKRENLYFCVAYILINVHKWFSLEGYSQTIYFLPVQIRPWVNIGVDVDRLS